jgi:hypothetical protein
MLIIDDVKIQYLTKGEKFCVMTEKVLKIYTGQYTIFLNIMWKVTHILVLQFGNH